MFFSKNISQNVANDLSLEASISITSNLSKYLGVPLHHDKIEKASFNFIIDKLNQKLSNRKKRHLSLPSRITLTKAVLNSIPFTLYANKLSSL